MQLKQIWQRLKEAPSPFSSDSSVSSIDYAEKKPKSNKELLQEKRSQRIKEDEKKVRETTLIFTKIALGAKLAGIDGEINNDEIESFESVFPETNHPFIELAKFFGNAANDDISFEHYAKRVTSYFPDEEDLYKDLLASLFEFGAVDGPLNVEEINFLHKINGIFELGDDFFFQSLRQCILPTSRNPYVILGINSKSSIHEIRTAYRIAAQAYHPDRFSSAGCAPFIIEIANERFNTILKAYEKIRVLKKL